MQVNDFISCRPDVLPDLKELQRRVTFGLNQVEDVVNEFQKCMDGFKNPQFNLSIFAMFRQMWGNTACGLNEPGMLSGQAMTECYTVVFYEAITKRFIICFGNTPAYIVTNPTPQFYEDMNNRCMKSRHVARSAY